MMGIVRGAIQAAYPKTLAANTTWNSFNPTNPNRRTYSFNGTFASPNFTDSPGWTWSAGGPLSSPSGYQLQIQMENNGIEGINGVSNNHDYAMAVAGAQTLTNVSAASGASDVVGPWTNESNSLAGTVTFSDWCANNSGGTAYVGVVTIRYQYIRS